MRLIEQVIEVMSDVRGGLHIKEIALLVQERFPNITIPAEKLPSKINSALAADVKKGAKKSHFAKVKNKNKTFKKGIYRLKKKPDVRPTPPPPPIVSNQYTGAAGEFAVMSELLFYGFNASSMTVDDGIDIVASKEKSYFHIQVKTANVSAAGVYSFSIKKSSFTAKNSFQTFYVFVIRGSSNSRYYNDYVILPSSQVRQLIDGGIIKDSANFSVRIQKDSRGRYLLNAKQDVTMSVNTFNQLV